MAQEDSLEDPRCPECGGPIAATATECLHCGATLAGTTAQDDTAGPQSVGEGPARSVSTAAGTPVEHPLDPEGVMDNTLTVMVGILGGLIIGVIGTVVLLFLTQSGWGAAFGFAAWLGATAYLVRRRYLFDAVSKTAYGIAGVLLVVPAIAVLFEGNLVARGMGFFVMLVIVAIPAGIAAAVGWFASRYVPEPRSVG
jgi:hypothetical protein